VGADIAAVIVCLLGSGFFSASETALSSLPITRLEALRERCGRLTRKGLDRWSASPQELLITILVGNNLVNVLASALATRIAYKLSSSGGLASVVGVMTLVILVFGEITPKTLAQRHAAFVTARVAPILYLLDVALRPVNKVLGLLSRLLSPSADADIPVTEEDLLFMLRLAHRHAQLPRDSRLMIESVLRFQQTVAREVMLPRPRVRTVDISLGTEQLRSLITETGKSRFPVVAGSPDEIVGVLHAKHLLQLENGQHWSDLVVPGLFVPETKRLPDLLQDFRSSGRHLAIVLDEFGGFSGIVTLEDLIELVVGEIEDEFDQERETAFVDAEGGWLVPGYLTLRRLERMLQRPLEQPDEYDSVGGLAASLVPRPLHTGLSVEWQGLRLHVTAVKQGRVTQILVQDLRRKRRT
jgi:putative hemolysin